MHNDMIKVLIGNVQGLNVSKAFMIKFRQSNLMNNVNI